MNDHLSRVGQEPSLPTPPGSAYLSGRKLSTSPFLRWWYSLTAPVAPAMEAESHRWQRFRRERVGSQLILALCAFLLLTIPSFVGTTRFLIPILVGTVGVVTLGSTLNRLGRVNVAGIVMVLTFTAFPILTMVTTPHGISLLGLPLFGFLLLPLLCAISFLAAWWVFIVALGNCLYAVGALLYLPHTADLSNVLALAFFGILPPMILSQMMVSVMAYA